MRAKHKEFLFPSTPTTTRSPSPSRAARAAGASDHDGNEYLDFFGGILTVSVGHANEKVNAAVQRADGPARPRVDAVPDAAHRRARREARDARAGQDIKKAFFCASGTEADETAVALAQVAHGPAGARRAPPRLLGRARCSRSRSTATRSYRVIPTQVAAIKHAHAPYCYRCPFGLKYPSCEVEVREGHRGADPDDDDGPDRRLPRRAHPWASAASSRRPTATSRSRSTSSEVRRRVHRDEVQTGFGRTGGKMWGIEHHEGVEPDIMTMAKGIANGYPIGAELATARRSPTRGRAATSPPSAATPSRAPRPTRRSTRSSTTSSSTTRPSMGKLLRDGLEALRRSTRGHRRRARQGADAGARAREGRDGEGPHARARDDRPPLRGDQEARPAHRQGRPLRQHHAHRAAAQHRQGDVEEALKILDDSFAALSRSVRTTRRLHRSSLARRRSRREHAAGQEAALHARPRRAPKPSAACIASTRRASRPARRAIDIPTFIKKIASGQRARRGADHLRAEHPRLLVRARVPGRGALRGLLRLQGWHREPIAIGRLQRYATETATREPSERAPRRRRRRRASKRRAASARAPRRWRARPTSPSRGTSAVVFEKRALPGGLNTTGIAPYKLHADDALHEVEWVRCARRRDPDGRRGRQGRDRGRSSSSEYDAVFLGVGLGADTKLGIPGEDGPGRRRRDGVDRGDEARATAAAERSGAWWSSAAATPPSTWRASARSSAPRTSPWSTGAAAAEMSGYAHEIDGRAQGGRRASSPSTVPVAVRARRRRAASRALRVARTDDGKPVPGTERELAVRPRRARHRPVQAPRARDAVPGRRARRARLRRGRSGDAARRATRRSSAAATASTAARRSSTPWPTAATRRARLMRAGRSARRDHGRPHHRLRGHQEPQSVLARLGAAGEHAASR